MTISLAQMSMPQVVPTPGGPDHFVRVIHRQYMLGALSTQGEFYSAGFISGRDPNTLAFHHVVSSVAPVAPMPMII